MRSPTPKYSYHKWRNDHGGALVEFAIVMPLLLLLCFGIIEFSLVFYNKAVLSNACREGARAGIILKDENLTTGVYTYPDQADIELVIENYLKRPDSDGNIKYRLISFGSDFDTSFTVDEITYTDSNGSGTTPDPGDSLTVRIAYEHRFLAISNIIKLFNSSLPQKITLEAKTVMRLF